MEENNEIIGEQLESQVTQPVATEDQGVKDSGSPLGKFKDAYTLLNAYNELQSAFTRKCQKLSETERKLEENMGAMNASENNTNIDNPKFAWDNNFGDFIKLHKNASNFVEDMAEEMVLDEDLKNSPDGLEKAYYKVMEKKFVPHGELAKNQDFLEKYIYNNDEIKNKIIKEYISQLDEIKNPIIVNNHGYSSGIATSQKFDNLADASKYVENMFRF